MIKHFDRVRKKHSQDFYSLQLMMVIVHYLFFYSSFHSLNVEYVDHIHDHLSDPIYTNNAYMWQYWYRQKVFFDQHALDRFKSVLTVHHTELE